MTDDHRLQELINKWLLWDKNEETHKEIENLLAIQDFTTLRLIMFGQLAFGTAGIRARMGAGFAQLNDLTIIQISNGFAKHILDFYGKEHKSRGVCVGYDGRYHSKRFAYLAANVFVKNNLKVYFFSEIVPTPVVSFATAALNCDAGLMITASHNPKEDNGYKVYWSNGAQIIAPHDVEICRLAALEPEPCTDYWNLNEFYKNPLIFCADFIIETYYKKESEMCYYKELNVKSQLKFTYSAFHGVGSKFVQRLFSEYGIPQKNVFLVMEQDKPDPNFPTVPFPNPEEGLKVLKLCIDTANKNDSQIILANDPDADRLQLAEKQADGEWRIFTGNEMGTILTWWIWQNWRAANPNADLSKVYMLNSVVSSQIVKTISMAEGFQNRSTLTGFKWMGNLVEELRAAGNQVILAWEESIGFLTGHTLDKDGVSAAAIFAEIANYLYNKEICFSQQLSNIYTKYGYHLIRSSYWIVPSANVTKQIFKDLRYKQIYPQKIGDSKIKFIRDLTTGYDNEQLDNKAILPLSKSSEMISFTLDTGSRITLRASGTEPKIKYYIELKTESGKTKEDLIDVLQVLGELEENVVQNLLKPNYYGLIRHI